MDGYLDSCVFLTARWRINIRCSLHVVLSVFFDGAMSHSSKATCRKTFGRCRWEKKAAQEPCARHVGGICLNDEVSHGTVSSSFVTFSRFLSYRCLVWGADVVWSAEQVMVDRQLDR